MSTPFCMKVPNVLGGTPDEAESFISNVYKIAPAAPVTLNLAAVSWMCPYGVVILLGACRYLAQGTRKPVGIAAMRQDVHAYLRRIDFFECAGSSAYSVDGFETEHDLGRSLASSNLLERVKEVSCSCLRLL